MKYCKLGHSDLDVSRVCLGTMTWGEQNTQQQAFAQMDMAVERGINFFDSAEMYPIPPKSETQGKTEEIIGNWLAARQCRDKIIIATKVTGPDQHNPGVAFIRNGPRLTREQIIQAVDSSLRRLRTDYIDLYQVHWPERATNCFGHLGYQHGDDDGIAIEESLTVLTELVTLGKIRYIGISNETPWGLLQYLRLAQQHGLANIVSLQNPYSLLNRTYEVGCAEICIRENISMLAYSPLALGKLTGKYLGNQKPAHARLTLFERFKRYDKINADQAIQAYVDLARESDLDPAQMALAYIDSRGFIASTIIGATNLAQLKDNIDSFNIELSADVLSKIDEIHARYPNPSP